MIMKKENERGITLRALVTTFLFFYDKLKKYSKYNSFLLVTI